MKNKAPARLRKKHYFGRGAMFVLCAIFAVLFLLPTVLTITNSFMSEAEIKSNYGMIFATTSGELELYIEALGIGAYITGLRLRDRGRIGDDETEGINSRELMERI